MIEITDTSTIPDVLQEAAARYAERPFLAVPPIQLDPPSAGVEMTYAEVAEAVLALTGHYQRAGYGVGHRVGLLLENRLDHFLHKLAMNKLGVCCVPMNPSHRRH